MKLSEIVFKEYRSKNDSTYLLIEIRRWLTNYKTRTTKAIGADLFCLALTFSMEPGESNDQGSKAREFRNRDRR